MVSTGATPPQPPAQPKQSKLKKPRPSTKWADALDTAESLVGASNYAAMTSSSQENLEKAMSTLGEQYQTKGIPKLLVKLQPMIANLKAFEGVIGTFTQANPEIANLVWGSMRVLLEVSARYVSTFTALVDRLAHSALIWPRFQTYRTLFPSYDRIESGIVDFYTHYVQFCGESIRFFKRRPLHAMLRFSWSKEEHRFETLATKMQECDAYLKEEANIAHMTDHQKDMDNLAKLIKKQLPDGNANLPCRRIPFAQNHHFFHQTTLFDQITTHTQSQRSKYPSSPVSILLHGLGGIGKTQTVTQLAYLHWDVSDAVIWINADSLPKLANDYYEAAKEMCLATEDERSAGIAALRRWFEETDKKWILIFDNVEDAQHLLDYWPRRGVSGTILLTSRGSLSGSNLVTDEILLEPLSVADSGTMLSSMLRLDPNDPSTNQYTQALAAQVHGLPLAISQVAGFVAQTKIPLSSCVDIYRKRESAAFLRSESTGMDRLQYQYTLNTVFSITFDKLNDNARSILDHCAILDPDSIPEDILMSKVPGLQAVSWNGDQLQFNLSLSDLFEYSLLRRNNSSTSLNIHREVQYSAIRELSQRDRTSLATTFSNVCRILYEAHPRQSPLGEPIPDWIRCEKFSRHIMHVYHVFVETCQSRASRHVLKLLTELYCDCGVYLWARGFLDESETLARASISIADDILEEHDYLRAQPRTLLGCILMCREHQLAEATTSLQEALTIREKHVYQCYPAGQLPMEVDIQLANAYNNLGIVKRQANLLDAAAILNEQSTAIKKKYPQDQMAFLLALSQHNQGQVRLAQGRTEEALTLLRESVTLISHTDSEMQVRKAKFLYSLGTLEMKLGDVRSAESSLLNALSIRQRFTPNSSVAALTSHRLGVLFNKSGEFSKAE
jgi:tetratricopeptide (TPR) repeat protein